MCTCTWYLLLSGGIVETERDIPDSIKPHNEAESSKSGKAYKGSRHHAFFSLSLRQISKKNLFVRSKLPSSRDWWSGRVQVTFVIGASGDNVHPQLSQPPVGSLLGPGWLPAAGAVPLGAYLAV